jgi:hypothetical protein
MNDVLAVDVQDRLQALRARVTAHGYRFDQDVPAEQRGVGYRYRVMIPDVFEPMLFQNLGMLAAWLEAVK